MVAAVLGFPAVPGTRAETNETEPEITVFYDGAGPRGVRDRAHDERWAGQAGERICGFDITGQDERMRALGLDPRRASTEWPVLDERQRLRSELEAYIRLLDRIPWLKPRAASAARAAGRALPPRALPMVNPSRLAADGTPPPHLVGRGVEGGCEDARAPPAAGTPPARRRGKPGFCPRRREGGGDPAGQPLGEPPAGPASGAIAPCGVRTGVRSAIQVAVTSVAISAWE